MVIRRKGNPRFKKIDSFVSTKSGLKNRKVFVLNRKPFEFKEGKSRSVVFAPTRKEAVRIHKLGLKQKRFDFGDVVLFARTNKEAMRKLKTERRRRR